MVKASWGTKRTCQNCAARFYDLNKSPIVSPYTGQVVSIDVGRARTMVADAEDAQTKRLKIADEDDLLLDEDDNVDDDSDLGDEVLEEDEDEDVSFEDLGDVASDDE